MKSDRYLSLAIAAVLAFLLSFGSVGCLATGFGLDAGMTVLAWVCGLAAVGSAVLAGRKWGGIGILCLLALGGILFCYSRDAREQLDDLICQIGVIYYRAYGWEWLRQGDGVHGAVGYPLGFLGVLVAARVAWSVMRRQDAFAAVLAALLPLGACLVVTDTVPREEYLYLLILGLLLVLLTAGLRQSDVRQGNALTLMAAIPLALALGGLFLAVPQESYVNKADAFYQEILDRYPSLTGQMSENSVIGNEDEVQVDLRNTGALIQRQYPVMDVVAPISGTMYLRGQDYDLYDGTDWTATPNRAEILSGDLEWMEAQGSVTVATLRELDFCFVPYYATGGAKLMGGSVKNSEEATAYGFAQKTLPENWRQLVETGTSSQIYLSSSGSASGEDSRYLELPEDTRIWAEELLETVLPEDLPVATDKAELIAAYVRASAEYDANTPKMPGDQRDFVRWFLTESDTGYCVHFASATAVLLRAAGVPARYVTGYMFQAEAGTPVTVRANQAHAWVEYYEERLGMWLVLESTPAMPDAPEETVPAQTETTAPQDTTEGTLPEVTTQPDVTDPQDSTQEPASDDSETVDSSWKLPDWLKTLGIVLLCLSVFLVAVCGQRQLRLGLRRRNTGKGSRNRRALAQWQELELLCCRLGQVPPEELEALAQKARFSQHCLTVRELQTMDTGVREARGLCLKKPWYQRLIDRYIYAAY